MISYLNTIKSTNYYKFTDMSIVDKLTLSERIGHNCSKLFIVNCLAHGDVGISFHLNAQNVKWQSCTSMSRVALPCGVLLSSRT